MKNLKVLTKIMLGSDEKKGTYGPGTDKLIKKIMETGSLNKATKEMNMSYSKAWKMLNKTEEMLGFELIERHSGARGSEITEKAKDLINYYEDLVKATERAIEEVNTRYGI